jgi:ADP-heptose:LPS heptosyltransferase
MLKEAIRDEDLVLPPFEPTAAERAEAVTLTRPPGRATDPGPVILLNPNCSDLLPLRRWPTERFVELGRCLLERYPGAIVAITGAPAERAEAERIAARIGPQDRAVCLAGRTTLRGLLALYSVSDLLVTNDSGPCHFAALTPIRLVALYGPETPMLYGPMGRRATAITAGLACSPCVNMLNHRFSPCRDNRCMAAISVERVFEAAVAALTAGGRVA